MLCHVMSCYVMLDMGNHVPKSCAVGGPRNESCHVMHPSDPVMLHPVLCYVMLCYVMLCYVMLCYVMLCYVMLCRVMLCYVMLCYVMLCYVMLCYVMLCSVLLWYVMLCYVMLCCVILCYLMLSYVMLCCVILSYLMLSYLILCMYVCMYVCIRVYVCAVLGLEDGGGGAHRALERLRLGHVRLPDCLGSVDLGVVALNGLLSAHSLRLQSGHLRPPPLLLRLGASRLLPPLGCLLSAWLRAAYSAPWDCLLSGLFAQKPHNVWEFGRAWI